MEAILCLIFLIVMIILTISYIVSEIKHQKEFKQLLEQLNYEDALNEISKIVKNKLKESSKITKIKSVLNKIYIRKS